MERIYITISQILWGKTGSRTFILKPKVSAGLTGSLYGHDFWRLGDTFFKHRLAAKPIIPATPCKAFIY